MNQIILIGNLGADIELKTTNSGKYVASVNIAVRDDFNREKTDWIGLVFWNKSAETAAQYLHKGSKIAVVGRLSTRSYENKDGQKRNITEVVVERFEFLDPKKETSWSGANIDNGKSVNLEDDTDLPF